VPPTLGNGFLSYLSSWWTEGVPQVRRFGSGSSGGSSPRSTPNGLAVDLGELPPELRPLPSAQVRARASCGTRLPQSGLERFSGEGTVVHQDPAAPHFV
jgi:hypothetical protein